VFPARRSAFCVLAAMGMSLMISPSAYSQTADCQAEAESISAEPVTTPGVYPGSVPGVGQPGVSDERDPTAAGRERLRAEVYAACVRRQTQNLPRSRTSVSDPGARFPRR